MRKALSTYFWGMRLVTFMCLRFRRHYIKKCEQLIKLKTEQDAEQESTIQTARNTLQVKKI